MKRKSLFPVLAVTCFAACLSSCGKSNVIDGITFVTEEEKKGPQFIEGCNTTYTFAVDTIMLNEIVDFNASDDFTLTIKCPDGSPDIDATTKYKQRPWSPAKPGKYTLVYTINSGDNKGTASIDLNVVVQKISWSYTLKNEPYYYGSDMIFTEYFEGLNSFVDSYYPYKTVMDNVEVDGKIIDLSTSTKYTFSSMSDHVFNFHVESEDGQIIKAKENISIKYINAAYAEELANKGLNYYGELLVGDYNNPDDKSITLKKGIYNNGNYAFLSASAGPHDMPYIATENSYGIGDLVKVDFSGDNMPILTFFREEIKNSLFDNSKGCIISGGIYDNSANPSSPRVSARISPYGPYLFYGYADRDFLGDGSTGNENVPYKASCAYLKSHDQNIKYRLLAGFTSIEKTKTATYLGYDFALLDLTNKKLLGQFHNVSYNINSIGKDVRKLGDDSYNFPVEWYQGKIALYGNYGKTTKLDSYPEIISSGTRTFNEVLKDDCGFVASTIKQGAPTNIEIDKEYEPSIFGDLSNPKAYVSVQDFYEEDIPLVDGKIKLSESGIYTVNYADGNNYEVAKTIYCSGNKGILNEDGHTYFDAIKNEDDSITFNPGFVSDGGTSVIPSHLTSNDLAHVNLNGNYGLKDYLSVDFTGNNMPIMTFFRDNNNISGSLFDDSKGVLAMGGLYNGDGSYTSPDCSGRIGIYGPTLFYKYSDRDYLGESSGGKASNPSAGSQIYLANHDENTKYRVIIGFSGYNEGNHVLTMDCVVVDLTNNAIVLKYKANSYNIHAIGSDIRNLDYSSINSSYFNGDIALYGNYAKKIKIDKFEVLEDRESIDYILTVDYKFKSSSFASDAPTFATVNKEFAANSFGDLSNPKSYVYITNLDGSQKIEPQLGKFVVNEVGMYKVVYCDGTNMAAERKIYISSLSTEKTASAYTHGVTMSGDSISLAPSLIADGAGYNGPNKDGIVDQSFYGFEGDYGLNTYVELDFKGKNMPNIAFFADNYDNSMYAGNGGKEGVMVVSGMTDYKGETHDEYVYGAGNSYRGLKMCGINMIDGLDLNWFYSSTGTADPSKLMRHELDDNTNYKLLMGIVKSGAKAIAVEWTLFNKDSSQVVENSSLISWNFFDGPGGYTDHNIGDMTPEDFSGSIVLYGYFGIETKIDKAVVHTSTTLANLKTECGII